MPKKSAATPRGRPKKVASEESPEPSRGSGTRKTPSRACKGATKFPIENPIRKTRSKIPTPIAEKPHTPKPGCVEPRQRTPMVSKLSVPIIACEVAPTPAAGVLDALNESRRSIASIAPQPSVGLIQDQSGFSDEDESAATNSTATIGIGDFNFRSSPGKRFSFNPPTNLSTSINKTEPFKFDFKTPATPKISSSITESLLALQRESNSSQAGDSSVVSEIILEQTRGDELVGQRKADPPTPRSASRLLATMQKTGERPTYKNRLSTLLRNRIGFKKGMQEIRATEDAGKAAATEEPTALHFKATNQLYVNVPFKARLLGVADTLGIGIVSLLLHCVIFMLSFWACNLLYTFYFPATEDERVNYFYEMLTRQKVGSFYVHMKHVERWFTWPRCQPEFLALICTIFASASIAKLLRRAEDHQTATKIKLVKLC